MFAVSLPTYVASLVVNVVNNHKGANFGQQRVWCSVSACIGSVTGGKKILIDLFDLKREKLCVWYFDLFMLTTKMYAA